MKNTECTVCCKNKTALQCDQCSSASCKHCCYFIDENCFEFQSLLPEELQGKIFCPNCYHESISDKIELLQETLRAAKQMDIYGKEQSAETRLIRRQAKLLRIKDCDDRKEILIQLAFLAAQQGFNTLVDVDLRSTKVNNGSYVKTIWSGTASPVNK